MAEGSKKPRRAVDPAERERSVDALRGVVSKQGGSERVERGIEAVASRGEAAESEQAPSPEADDIRYLMAIFGASYLVARADGELSDEERRHLFAILSMSTGGRIAASAVEKLIEVSEENLRGVDLETAVRGLVGAFKSRDDREAALTLALGTAAADGHIDENELTTLGALARAFGISPERSKIIYQEVFLALAEARTTIV